jgi:hypothetical protein
VAVATAGWRKAKREQSGDATRRRSHIRQIEAASWIKVAICTQLEAHRTLLASGALPKRNTSFVIDLMKKDYMVHLFAKFLSVCLYDITTYDTWFCSHSHLSPYVSTRLSYIF